MKYVLAILCTLLITNGFAQKRKEAQTQLQVAHKAMIKADSIARRAYANDLAYRSQIALEKGKLNAAYRLAEFAYHYVDDRNLNVTGALVQALYHNDEIDQVPLAWGYD
jgi:sensor histidine kinase regulating citrate/malate metabolism